MMRIAYLIALLAFPAFADEAPQDGFCIKNSSDYTHLFQTETREGATQSARLAPDEQLCATATKAADGVIRVFENEDVVEGCGRIVPVGTTEALIAYAEFDRCAWGSHNQ
ncbi:MAG: hypothetical protein ABJF50_11655 [Paracoccaceae bacterium]